MISFATVLGSGASPLLCPCFELLNLAPHAPAPPWALCLKPSLTEQLDREAYAEHRLTVR